MKYLIYIFLFCVALTSCEEDYPKSYEGLPYIRFSTDEQATSVYVQHQYVNYLYLGDETIVRDTIDIPVEIVGAAPEQDLHLSLEAFDSDDLSYPERIDRNTINAEAGVHYVPFDDAEMSDLLTFHAGRMQDTISVIILRDATLQESTYRLTFKLSDSENSIVADNDENRAVVYMADRLSQPSNWSSLLFTLGNYGFVKHEFMIRHSDLIWNDEDVEMIANDSFLSSYYKYKFMQDLEAENEALGENGPLKEADGSVVTFQYSYY
ncbi:DUF4843 domain-containing protein [Plebeiibacterium sediminum]|uniref:DUF4843 domain-containing protein n=1 Tax=Plebeiibacterium sediminum TaxID=2992112 RepID=A0AAE3M5R5_9BACT|nr:DUF4843 domain-containing protein [Plebeiobacterium sediminum]MCW3787766.1 DUF4843 domain-containing protein [Plebeiobacterium sediminum]